MRALSAARTEDAAAPGTGSLGSHDLLRKAGEILLFSPLPGEADPLPLMDLLPHARFLFPRMEGETLGVFRHSQEGLWLEGPFGLREPDPGTCERVYPEYIDLALIPGLAFDARGGRLGRGKGYYDRLLGDPRFRGIKVGFCHEWQLVDLVPREAHDIAMDLVIAGGRVIDARSMLDIPGESG